MSVGIAGAGTATVSLFVAFGLVIGVLFGFFGMGGSFLVTPALLVMGFRSEVAVGSGLAFVFGTSVIGALRHRGLGQVDYKLAVLMVVGMTTGIELGKSVVELFRSLGFLDLFVSVAYVGLLAGVGLITLRDARTESTDVADGGRVAAQLRTVRLPPLVSLKGGATVSVWAVLGVGLAIGVLSGILGVGGGFLLMPAMLYGFGVPAAVAVGTDILQITISGAYGAFTYAQSGFVDLTTVAALLLGSALGARVGSAATEFVDEDDIKGYFGLMLLGGAFAVGIQGAGPAVGIPAVDLVSLVLILVSACLVAGAIVLSSVRELRDRGDAASGSTAD